MNMLEDHFIRRANVADLAKIISQICLEDIVLVGTGKSLPDTVLHVISDVMAPSSTPMAYSPQVIRHCQCTWPYFSQDWLR